MRIIKSMIERGRSRHRALNITRYVHSFYQPIQIHYWDQCWFFSWFVMFFSAIHQIQVQLVLEYESEPEIDLDVDQQLEYYVSLGRADSANTKPVNTPTRPKYEATSNKKTGKQSEEWEWKTVSVLGKIENFVSDLESPEKSDKKDGCRNCLPQEKSKFLHEILG